ncbi:MAG: magnesium and cobalt transport protein CorA [Caldilineae bacterium]|nr:MAG: magnesium and cobalt transport protein CorA [Caldilineae bacterium]
MVRILYRHASGTVVRDLPVEQLAAALREPNAVLWVDLHAPSPEDQRRVLEQAFAFHPLAIEDAITSFLVPKINDYRRYLYIVFHTIYEATSPMDIRSSELDVFLGPNYLVTIHEREMQSIDTLWSQPDSQMAAFLGQGPAQILYTILDRQVDRFERLLDNFEANLERLGDIIFQNHSDADAEENLLDDLLTAQSSTLRLARVLQPQRDLLLRLSQTDYSVIPGSARVYFADIYDHLVRMVSLVQAMRELTRSTIDIYMALSNNRMNEIMKVLTIISTTFLPLGFLAGVYGMNFRFMPELEWPWMYPLIWVVFLAIAGAMLIMFRRRKWL